MDATTSTPTTPAPAKKKRNYTVTPPLPPPPAGVEVVTREQAAAVLGVTFGWFARMEMLGLVPIQRYRLPRHGRVGVLPIVYARADVEALREERRREEESYTNPQPHPDLPGVYRVAIRSHVHTLHALIDAEDLSKVQGRCWNWRPASQKGRPGEVTLSGLTDNTPLKRIILGLEHAGKETNIVYANGDPLDCRRANLVVRSNSEKNRAKRRADTVNGRPVSSKYKGVTWDSTRRVWKAQAGSRETFRVVGRFRDEVEAALAYDQAAREIYGPGTFVNFPDPHAAPPPTCTGPDGAPVREFNNYTVTPPLPPPPDGVAVMTREEGAELLGVGESTFAHWERDGRIAIPQYRVKPVTGTPILYAVPDLERLRDEFAKERTPFQDPRDTASDPTCWRVPIWTRQGPLYALVDEQDLGIVRGRVWSLSRGETAHGDECGSVILNGPRGTTNTPLRRIIMGVHDKGDSILVVNRNGDPLDCRRRNLELRTRAQRARRTYKITHRNGEPTTSRYKGVFWSESHAHWQAQICLDGRSRPLGHFDAEEDAARAYDEAARAAWGREARVNFPEQGELPTALRQPSPVVVAATAQATPTPAAPPAAATPAFRPRKRAA